MTGGKLKGILIIALGALTCSGCIAFVSPPAAIQKGRIGVVQISFKVCATEKSESSPPPGSCTNTDGNSDTQAFTGQSQVWLGFRLPSGTVVPTAFASSSTGPADTGPQLQFTQSKSYASELQRLDPAPARMEWVGYVSQYVAYSDSAGDQNFTAAVAFGLPTEAHGLPFAGPFKYRVVVGGRLSSTPNANEPVSCGSSLTKLETNSGNSEYWVCVDDPATGSGAGELNSNSLLATRDAGIKPGPKRRAKAGKTVKVRFKFVYRGSTGAGRFKFSASTSVPGGSAHPSVRKFRPTSNRSKTVVVTVGIPKNTTAGNYQVRLVARLSDGEFRAAVVGLHVSRHH